MTKPVKTRPATGHITPFGLRMQPELKERLEEAAHKAGRSLNAEVVDRLERSFGADVQPTDDEVEALLIKAVNLLRSKG
ncbi:hypothetical protein DIR46_07115 [Massilia oculi]|uniref:Arc-like DNA binding domain-containing protein n=2 Tax=Massilia oculi TaxID=945844 RepID=A0A2S2DFT6_9BURK|nr:hypothetical protein DIR46_07115 [Massilia oculi]